MELKRNPDKRQLREKYNKVRNGATNLWPKYAHITNN